MQYPQCGESEKKLARQEASCALDGVHTRRLGTFVALGKGTQVRKCTISTLVSMQTWVESQLLHSQLPAPDFSDIQIKHLFFSPKRIF